MRCYNFILELASNFPHRFTCKLGRTTVSLLLNRNFELNDFKLPGVGFIFFQFSIVATSLLENLDVNKVSFEKHGAKNSAHLLHLLRHSLTWWILTDEHWRHFWRRLGIQLCGDMDSHFFHHSFFFLLQVLKLAPSSFPAHHVSLPRRCCFSPGLCWHSNAMSTWKLL